MNNFKKVLAIPLHVLRAASFLLLLFNVLRLIHWYISWLDEYFLLKYFAVMVGIMTAPLVFIASIIDWAWHGFPWYIFDSLMMMLIATLLFGACHFIINKLTKENNK